MPERRALSWLCLFSVLMAAVKTITASTVPAEDELALYWDPRYHRFFYAGALETPAGQLYDLTGKAIKLPTDTWSVVEVEQDEDVARREARSSWRPILITQDRGGWLERRTKKRRISWSSFPTRHSETVVTEQTALKDQGGASSGPHLFIYLAFIFVIALLVLLWLWTFWKVLSQMTEDSTIDSDLTMTDVLVVRPSVPGRISRSSPLPILPTADIQGRQHEESTNISIVTP